MASLMMQVTMNSENITMKKMSTGRLRSGRFAGVAVRRRRPDWLSGVTVVTLHPSRQPSARALRAI